jgi:hypothetical protein
MTALEPDRAEAERFLQALDPSPDARWCFQTFTDDKKARKARAEENKLRKQQHKPELKDPLAAWRYGTLTDHWSWLVKQNARGAGVYVCVNETDGNGRKKINIKRIRALFVDLDGAPIGPVNNAELKSQITMESSPDRYQAYWCFSGRMPLKVFKPLQEEIAARFKGDPSVHDLSRVMRLPGFVHRKEKDKPFLSRIVAINGVDLHRASVLLRTFRPAKRKDPPPPPPPPPRDDDKLQEQWRRLNGEAIRRYDDWVPHIFPSAARTSEGGYRVSSATLGRDLEEDLSFHREGIKDFGVADIGDWRRGSRTPIDVVEQYLRKDFTSAVRWLAEKLGLDPRDYLPKGKGIGEPTLDAEVTRLAALPEALYDRQRKTIAEKFKIRPITLDKLVAHERARQAHAKGAPKRQGVMAELNRDNCVVLDGARGRILRFEEVEHDAGGEHYVYRVPTFLRPEDFRLLYLNREITANGAVMDIGKYWLTHKDRRQYPGIIFKPNGAPIINGKLNLWRGWGVAPRRGDWGLMREHIFEVMAARDDDVDLYTLNWLAWAVQHPDEQPEVALVFKGERGTGRGTLGKAMCKLFGQHARHISSPAHLTGRFNAHLRQISFLFCDESYAPGDKSAEGTLKRVITEPTLTIEPKGRDVMEEPNRVHAMLASNEDWIIPAGAHERRFQMQDVASSHRQDASWFAPLYEELRNGGYEAMLFDLLERDLGDWHPRQIVHTAALTDQQEQSLSPLDSWLFELLQTGVLTGADSIQPDRAISNRYKEEIEEKIGYGGTRTRTVYRDGLYDEARRSSPKLKGETDAAFGRYLGKQGCERAWVRRHRGWQFPPLDVCRERWRERFPQTQWRDPGVKSWRAEED